jgi:hypothetical protein
MAARQQGDLLGGCRRALRGRIEFAQRLNFVAEHLDTHWPVRLRRIGVDQAAPMRELAWHLNHVHLGVSGESQVLDQILRIEHLAPAHNPRETGVKRGITQPHARRDERRDHDMRRTGHDFPQRGGALFLYLQVRRKIFKRQHVVSGEADDRLRRNRARQLGQRANHGQQFVHRPVVAHHHDQRVRGGALQ